VSSDSDSGGRLIGRASANDSGTRRCKVCGGEFVPADRRQVYCTTRCRWRQGHIEAAEARRRWLAQRHELTSEELIELFDRQDWGPLSP
jgi:hypothetical protein